MKKIKGIVSGEVSFQHIKDSVSKLSEQSLWRRLLFAWNPRKYRKYSHVTEECDVSINEVSSGNYHLKIEHKGFDFDCVDIIVP